MLRIALYFALFLFSLRVGAQQVVEVNLLDTLMLDAGDFQGDIQWQGSTDGETWEALDQATTSPFKATVYNIPYHYRAQISQPNCPLDFSETITLSGEGGKVLFWSDEDAWAEQGKPQAGEEVLIPEGIHMVLDEDSPNLGGLTINGTLSFDRKNIDLSSKWILVHGQLQIGTIQYPFKEKATITLTDTDLDAEIMGMGTRGIMVMGGTLNFHAESPEVKWTKINQHAAKDATSIQLIETVSWKVDDEIVIAPTDYYRAGIGGVSITQKSEIVAASGSNITIKNGLNAFRWGLLQYPLESDPFLTTDANHPDRILTPPVPDTEEKTTPLVLDERAEIGNLTRNILIQAPDDEVWNNHGFGVHIMIMGPESEAYLDGVEIRRGGQRGNLGRYPFHWHMLSYSGSETLEDATGQYFRNSTVNISENRGIVIHGTNGVTVQNNIVYNIKGHGIFTEDAVERRNIIDGNLVLHIRNSSQPLKIHEGAGGAERGSSGFWISNPDNTVINNTAADCQTNGFWLAFTTRPWGQSQLVTDTRDGLLLNPSRLLFGVFDNNTAHSNNLEGINLDLVEISEQGEVGGFQYYSTTNGRDPSWPFETLRRFTLSNYNVWKNGMRGIWDRATSPDNYGIVSADNCERFFAGAGANGVIERSLVIGTSLNHLMNNTGRPLHNFGNFHNGGSSVGNPVAFATYHSTFDIKNNLILNFNNPPANTWGGVFATDDYYSRPIEMGMARNTDNHIINSHPGVKLRSEFGYFTLASAIWDPEGLWGPAGNYFVYNDPFLTIGKTITQVEGGADVAGGVSVPGPFYGFEGFALYGAGDVFPKNQPYFDLMGLHVKRLDPISLGNDASNENITSSTLATWEVAPAEPYWKLSHMRDFAASPDAIYDLSFSWRDNDETVGYPTHPTNFYMNVEAMVQDTDQLVIGIQYEGSLNPIVGLKIHPQFFPYTEVGSLQEVRDSEGETWWQDKANNRVWVKLKGGRFSTVYPEFTYPSDEYLLQTSVLRIFTSGNYNE